ncbi:MAG: FAD/NAD(P)-binding protein [Clostridia bacterium]|nr:FAD/NAD(P)-binding protein [Clostridia bacterium]
MNTDNIIPIVCKVIGIDEQTEDIKTFKVVGLDNKKPFVHIPGQCAMISIPPFGEAMISITSSPTNEDYLEFSIKKVGSLTSVLHDIEVGQNVLIRGPLGNGFPINEFKNKNLIIIGGGIGIAPVRSVINYVLDNREDFKNLDIVYGVRNENSFVYLDEINSIWQNSPNTKVHLTVDGILKNWTKNVGFVPDFVEKLNFDSSSTVILCGPPIMIKLTLNKLLNLGFKKENIYTTLEMRMKCGIGKCGRCNIGNKYVCKDGPVFRMDELEDLPNEY